MDDAAVARGGGEMHEADRFPRGRAAGASDARDGERRGPDLVCSRSGRRYREIAPNRIEECT